MIPISPSTKGVKNDPEMRLDRDDEPDAMNDGLRGEIVRTTGILENMCDMYVGSFSICTLSATYAYQLFYVGFSLCYPSTLF